MYEYMQICTAIATLAKIKRTAQPNMHMCRGVHGSQVLKACPSPKRSKKPEEVRRSIVSGFFMSSPARYLHPRVFNSQTNFHKHFRLSISRSSNVFQNSCSGNWFIFGANLSKLSYGMLMIVQLLVLVVQKKEQMLR